jgi:hypothetical protein
MNASRRSDKVTWWAMGKRAVATYGREKAVEMAQSIKVEGIKNLFLSGVNGEPKPRSRPVYD